MKKRNERLIRVSAIVLIISAFTGCSLFTPLPSILGKPVKVKEETGYFEEKLVYTQSNGAGYELYTFDTNGFYSYEFYSWDSTEEMYTRFSGDRGSYSWDPDTLICQLTINSEYNDFTDEWAATLECPYTETFPAYFTDINWYGKDSVLIQDDSNERLYVITYTTADAEGDAYKYTVNVQINNDQVGVPFEVFVEEENSNETGITDKDETEFIGTILGVFDSGKQAGKGAVTTFQIEFSVIHRDWDPETEWGEWSLPYEYQDFRTFLDMKTFLIENPSISAARKLK